MKQLPLMIQGLPAILWGPTADIVVNKLFIAVHGDQFHKADTVIEILAQHATQKGYHVLAS